MELNRPPRRTRRPHPHGPRGGRQEIHENQSHEEPRISAQSQHSSGGTGGGPTEAVQGILELHPDGYGFLRTISISCAPSPLDPFVSTETIRRYELRGGERIEGQASLSSQGTDGYDSRSSAGNGRYRNQPQGRNQRRPQPQQRRPQGPRLQSVTTIEGNPPDLYRERPFFDRLTPIDPRKWLRLETDADRLTTRVIDLFTPIGKGTRGLIVAPPRTGKTILLQHLADAIASNHPDVELMVLLIDERPEEVTEIRRAVKGQVFASSNDLETVNHVRLAQLVIDRAKRLVEMGRDVVILLDSITRLARAYNKHVGSGRTMTGGLDIKALDMPKKLFGSARCFDEGGSLTIMGTALIETGSKMDDVIFQEFKGTGNMELVLDRKLSEKRIYPAIDLCASGTRKEERLLPPDDLERIIQIRRTLSQMSPIEAMEMLLKQMGKYSSNKEFLESIAKQLSRASGRS